jgi:hypothetical protein
VCARDVAGPVARPVVDDEHRSLDPANRSGDPGEDLADAVLLVVGGDHDRHPVAELGR